MPWISQRPSGEPAHCHLASDLFVGYFQARLEGIPIDLVNKIQFF